MLLYEVGSFHLYYVLFSEGLFQEIVTLAEKCFEVQVVLNSKWLVE